MTDVTPTRSVALELKEEGRAMRDSHAFLDEKCLLLAGEILRELGRYDTIYRQFLATHRAAAGALQAALARHGLQGLQVYPAADLARSDVACIQRSLMGVRLQEATWSARAVASPPAFDASSEAEACRRAFAAVFETATPLGAIAGNLVRLAIEYRRSVRRARALQDVLLPELDGDVAEIESRLEEIEQEDAIWMRSASRRA